MEKMKYTYVLYTTIYKDEQKYVTSIYKKTFFEYINNALNENRRNVKNVIMFRKRYG